VREGSCLKFHLPLASDLEIMASRSDLGDSFQVYYLCSKKVLPAQVNKRFVIKTDMIKESCKEMPNDLNLLIMVGEGSDETRKLIKMDYSVEFENDIITLADGVAYSSRGYSVVGTALRTFFYDIVDEGR
jgi:hypothetical protein